MNNISVFKVLSLYSFHRLGINSWKRWWVSNIHADWQLAKVRFEGTDLGLEIWELCDVKILFSLCVKSLSKVCFFFVDHARIRLQDQKYLCSCSPKLREKQWASWQSPLAACHCRLRLQCGPEGKNNHEFCLTRAIEWHLFLDGLWVYY